MVGIGGYLTDRGEVFIDGFMVPKKMLRNWNPSLIECYKRGCNCEGCTVKNDLSDNEIFKRCHVKKFVRALILIGKYPDCGEIK